MLDNMSNDIDKREGSFVSNMVSPVGTEFAKYYMELDNILAIMFLEDATNEFLDKKVHDFGVYRKLGQNSKGFIKATKKFQNIYNLRLDKIRYANLSICKQKDLINDKTAQRLIFKTPEFSYQQEVRLVIDDPFSTIHITKDKRLCYFENDEFFEYKGKTYHLGNLQEYAIKLNVTDLIKIDETHYGFEYGLVKEIVEKMI